MRQVGSSPGRTVFRSVLSTEMVLGISTFVITLIAGLVLSLMNTDPVVSWTVLLLFCFLGTIPMTRAKITTIEVAHHSHCTVRIHSLDNLPPWRADEQTFPLDSVVDVEGVSEVDEKGSVTDYQVTAVLEDGSRIRLCAMIGSAAQRACDAEIAEKMRAAMQQEVPQWA